MLVTDDADLQSRAPALWRTLREAPVAPPVRATLERILEFGLFERFQTLTAEEIWTMLNILVPIEETRAYQSIFAKGEATGEAKGEAKSLKRLLTRRFGPLPTWATERIDAAAIAALDAWLENIFDTQSLEDLLGPPPQSGE
jgi:predicted transposase YdaD